MLAALLKPHSGKVTAFERDPERFKKATALLGAAETELATAEERWLTLEMLREAQGA